VYGPAIPDPLAGAGGALLDVARIVQLYIPGDTWFLLFLLKAGNESKMMCD